MKPEELKKMIIEQLDEVLSSQYNTLDKVLNALLAGKITKAQAKRFINDINKGTVQTTTAPSSAFDCGSGTVDFDCSYGMSKQKSKPTKRKTSYDDYCSNNFGRGVRGC